MTQYGQWLPPHLKNSSFSQLKSNPSRSHFNLRAPHQNTTRTLPIRYDSYQNGR